MQGDKLLHSRRVADAGLNPNELKRLLEEPHHENHLVLMELGKIASNSEANLKEKEEAFHEIFEWLRKDGHPRTTNWDILLGNKTNYVLGMQLVAIDLAGMIGDSRAANRLYELINENPGIIDAAVSLAEIGDSRAMKYLQEELEWQYNGGGDEKREFLLFTSPTLRTLFTSPTLRANALGFDKYIENHRSRRHDIWELYIQLMYKLDAEYTILIIDSLIRTKPESSHLARIARAYSHIGDELALCELIRIIMAPENYIGDVNKKVRVAEKKVITWNINKILGEHDPKDVGAAIESLGLLKEAEKWYTEKGLFEETARIRKLIAEMGATNVSQKVVQGDENITINKGDESILIQDSVVTESFTDSKQGYVLIEQLERLGQLKDKGVLTDDEFAHAKRKLLEY